MVQCPEFIKYSYDTIVFRLDLDCTEQMRALQYYQSLPDVNKLDSGIIRYKYGMEFDGIRIYLSDSTALHPNVRIRFLSEYIQRVGWRLAHKTLCDIFCGMLGLKSAKRFKGRIILSQVDVAFDFAKDLSPWINNSLDFRVVTRHQTKRTYQRGEKISWQLFGSGSAGWKVRVYDKLNEVHNILHKKYWLGVWSMSGFADPEHVWRVEFEIKNDMLKKFGIVSLQQLEGRKFQQILQYCISGFHVVLNDNSNPTRCTWTDEFLYMYGLSTGYKETFYDFTPKYFKDLRDNALSRVRSAAKKAMIYALAYMRKLTNGASFDSLNFIQQFQRHIKDSIVFDFEFIKNEVSLVLQKKGMIYD